jgi:hypothetical protein
MAAGEPRTIDLPCDVRDVEADAVTVHALAGLQLAARRHGCRIHLRNASTPLVELIEFMGLSDVLPNQPPAGSNPLAHRLFGADGRAGRARPS